MQPALARGPGWLQSRVEAVPEEEVCARCGSRERRTRLRDRQCRAVPPTARARFWAAVRAPTSSCVPAQPARTAWHCACTTGASAVSASRATAAAALSPARWKTTPDRSNKARALRSTCRKGGCKLLEQPRGAVEVAGQMEVLCELQLALAEGRPSRRRQPHCELAQLSGRVGCAASPGESCAPRPPSPKPVHRAPPSRARGAAPVPPGSTPEAARSP